MIQWIPIAVDEPPLFKGRRLLLPTYSAAVVGRAVVLRLYGGGFGNFAFSVTTIPFDSSADAAAWIEANKVGAAPAAG